MSTPEDLDPQTAATRLLRPQPFANDDGSRPAAVAQALNESSIDTRGERLLAALRDSRLLIPVLPHEHPGTVAAGINKDGVGKKLAPARHTPQAVGAKAADPAASACASAAMVAVATPDGRAALPAFTSMEAMRAWDDTARPVPVAAPRAAAAALGETDGLMVIDPNNDITVFVGRPWTQALATGEQWQAPWTSEAVIDAIGQALAGTEHLLGFQVTPGEKAETRVVLALPGGLSPQALQPVLTHVQQALTQSTIVRNSIDSLELTPVPIVDQGAEPGSITD